MKKIVIICFLSLFGFRLSGQEKVKDVIDDDYVRNSVSVIVVNRGDRYDTRVFNAVGGMNFGEKFDINKIPTDRIVIRSDRKHSVDVDQVSSVLENKCVGREIVSFWFQRDANGNMSDELVLSRGMYSVRDQEILNSQVSKVGISALGEKGYDLVDGSYVYVLDYYDLKEAKDKYSANVKVYIYKLDYNEDLAEELYETWIYDDDTEQIRIQKRKQFESLKFPLAYVTTVDAVGNSSAGLSDALRTAYTNAFYQSEKKVDDWMVTSSVISTHPIKAKIGTKEGVRNGQRYQVFKIVENRDGELDSRKVGYVRATEVVNNSRVATGATDASSFYQISGVGIEEGMILKQKNDLKMGITVAGGFGAFAPFEVGLEFLQHINTKGTARYIMANIGVDGAMLNDLSYTFVNILVGMGIALKPIRQVEIMPFLQVGTDVLSTTTSALSSVRGEEFEKWAAFLCRAGARISWQIFYPVQVFAQAEAAARLDGGVYYKYYNDKLLLNGRGHDAAAVGFSFGVKVSF